MLRARTISYPDPVAATVSGGYIESVLDGLGIKEAARSKAALKPMGYLVGEAVENGEAERGLYVHEQVHGRQGLEGRQLPGGAAESAALFQRRVRRERECGRRARFHRFRHEPAARTKLTAAGVVPAEPHRAIGRHHYPAGGGHSSAVRDGDAS